jgi:hypothetical protein
MPLKPAAQLPQSGKLFHREVATLSQSSIEKRSSMPLAENKSVTLNPLRL